MAGRLGMGMVIIVFGSQCQRLIPTWGGPSGRGRNTGKLDLADIHAPEARGRQQRGHSR
jgi:hypothetical protein